jgi:hypothetical protein
MTTDASTTRDHRPVAILALRGELSGAEWSACGERCLATEPMQGKV